MGYCNVIATGYSINDLDLSIFDDSYNIGVNAAYRYIRCDETVFFDNHFDRYGDSKNPQYLGAFGGQWLNQGDPINLRPGYVSGINLSVIMAINVAVHRGFDEIRVYGNDNKLTSGFLHFYDEEPLQDKKLIDHYEFHFRYFDKVYKRLKAQLKELNVIFVNTDYTL